MCTFLMGHIIFYLMHHKILMNMGFGFARLQGFRLKGFRLARVYDVQLLFFLFFSSYGGGQC